MPEMLKKVFIFDNLPYTPRAKNGPSILYEVHSGASDVGWGLSSVTNIPADKYFGAPGEFTYGYFDDSRIMGVYGALIICAETVASSNRRDWPVVSQFRERNRGSVPVAVVHSEPLPDGLVLNSPDFALPAHPLDTLRPRIADWLMQISVLVPNSAY